MYDLNFCGINIEDSSLRYFKNIKHLNLKQCNQITDNGLEYLKGVPK